MKEIFQISPLNRNTKNNWERYHQEVWLKNSGCEQTKLFAHYFLNTIRLPRDAKSLLDVGCAFGDALPEFRRRYPHLKLFGCDISGYAIREARRNFGQIAKFELWNFDEIVGQYDIIYCSNTLEHFENYMDITRRLMADCKWLYVLVPFMEMKDGKFLKVEADEWHVASFEKHSFDQLIQEGYAARIRSRLIYTPGAWGSGPVPFRQKMKAWSRGKPSPIEQRQIIFEILAPHGSEI